MNDRYKRGKQGERGGDMWHGTEIINAPHIIFFLITSRWCMERQTLELDVDVEWLEQVKQRIKHTYTDKSDRRLQQISHQHRYPSQRQQQHSVQHCARVIRTVAVNMRDACAKNVAPAGAFLAPAFWGGQICIWGAKNSRWHNRPTRLSEWCNLTSAMRCHAVNTAIT